MSSAINIGNRRELFWDEYLINTEETTAKLKLHELKAKEVIIDHNDIWEGDCCMYHCILKDDDFYRMYYIGGETLDPNIRCNTLLKPHPFVICYAESKDGKSWIKPKLGICEYEDSKENNIILDHNTAGFNNFSVFKDVNPNCPKDELYKGVGIDENDKNLWCFTSANGINFKKAWHMTGSGTFDSLNIAFWDKYTNQYICYIRHYHNVPGKNFNTNIGDIKDVIRDIRWMVSKDFKSWTIPVLLDFEGKEDYQLYTNVIQPYYRADHMLVGFPSRYVEREKWTPNFDYLPGLDRRKKRMKIHPRCGLAITDCIFMSSRDGKKWKRWDEAFMTPGLEHDYNWVYGDCFPALGLIETENDLPYAQNELSMYVFENRWSLMPVRLRRYTIRVDGFVSYNGTYKSFKVVTKPFIFKGSKLSINFASSAAGYIKIRLIGKDMSLNSCEIFGDSLDREVIFDGNVASLAGKPVKMEIILSDTDIYSFRFKR